MDIVLYRSYPLMNFAPIDEESSQCAGADYQRCKSPSFKVAVTPIG